MVRIVPQPLENSFQIELDVPKDSCKENEICV